MQALNLNQVETLNPGLVYNPGRILSEFFDSLPKRNRLVASPLLLQEGDKLRFNAYLIYKGKFKANYNLRSPFRTIKMMSRYEKDTNITNVEIEVVAESEYMLIRSFKVLGFILSLALTKPKA